MSNTESERGVAQGGSTDYAGRDLESMANARNYYAWMLSEFSPFLGATGAEIGAGSGTFSAYLAASGLSRLVSLEPSPGMYAQLESKFRGHAIVETRQGLLEDAAHLYREKFDSVTYVNVLEHIRDDARELQLARETLVHGGHILIFVPAHQALYSRFDKECGHFRRYSRKSLTETVKRAGYSIRKVTYFDLPGAFVWFLLFVLMRRTLTGGSVMAYDRIVIPLARRVERVIPPPFGKNLLLVAEKV